MIMQTNLFLGGIEQRMIPSTFSQNGLREIEYISSDFGVQLN